MNFDEISLTELADHPPEGPEWQAWLAAHPAAAQEIEIARRVHALVARLREQTVPVPPDFEARLMERVRADTTLLDLLELSLSGMGRTLIEIINAFLGLLPAPQPTSS